MRTSSSVCFLSLGPLNLRPYRQVAAGGGEEEEGGHGEREGGDGEGEAGAQAEAQPAADSVQEGRGRLAQPHFQLH